MRDENNDYYPKRRFEIPKLDEEFESPYDISSSVLQDLIQRKIQPLAIQTINLSTAGRLEVNVPGRAIVAYGWETADGLLRTVNTTASLQMFLETDPGQSPTAGVANAVGFPLKHARGYRGPFTKVYLYWVAQAGVSVDLVVHRFKGHPWVDGESAT